MKHELDIESILKVLKKNKAPEQATGAAEHRGTESSTKEQSVKETEDHSHRIPKSKEIKSLLDCISSDCPYGDWVKVCCVLKHEG